LPDSSLRLPINGIDFSALGRPHRLQARLIFPGDEDSSNNVLDTIITPQMDAGNSSLNTNQLCRGDTVLLSNQNSLGRPLWEYSSNGTNWDSLAAATQALQQVNQTTFYRFSVCGQLFSPTFEVEVPQPKVEPGILQFCEAGLKELSAITDSQTQSVNWYANAEDSLPLHQGLSFSTEISSNAIFYLEAVIDSCISSERVPLEVELGHCQLQIPNVFSPNGDGINDSFYYRQLGNQDLSTQIFNRWGEQVAGWQGNLRWDGGDLSEGVYFYVIKDRKSGQRYQGTVTLVR